MKILPFFVLPALAIVLALPAPGQSQSPSPSPSPVASPRRDPFVKNVTADGSNDMQQDESPNLIFTMEVYSMAQEDAASILDAGNDGEARHKAVLDLMNTGKARLEKLMCLAGKSGQRVVNEEVDEVRYATEYQGSPTGDPAVYASAFETRNVGDTVELEPTVSADGTICNLNIVPQIVHFLGFRYAYGDSTKPPAMAQPLFQTAKFTTSLIMRPSRFEFMGTFSAPPDFESKAGQSPQMDVRLAFGKIDLIPIHPDVKSAGASGLMELQLTFYSLQREAARQILSQGVQGEEIYNAVKALEAKHEAKLERESVLRTLSGQRAVVEECSENRYPTEFGINLTGTGVPLPSKLEVVPTAFETRSVGLTLEVEPVLDPSGQIVDLNMVPQMVSYEGDLQTGTTLQKFQPQPLFETRKITTSFTSRIGEHALIGTYSHPGDTGVNGHKDDGETWLGFIRVVNLGM